ncbi:MAG TPA: peptidoglycan DD-metalloendopeptidase family protein [Acidimicrobiia bacterium]|nr:peptidoglycan DD-metalloendopeptidase family protein [Acidimicrobiia bacterium]
MQRVTRRILLVIVVAGLTAPGLAWAEEAPLAWKPPVGGGVVRAFRPGVGAFEVSGHAGVDYAPTPDTPVTAAGDGAVAFVGTIAGALFVVVDHGGGVRTTYGQLAAASVRRRQAVRIGDPLGTSGGAGMHDHAPTHVHFGLRVDGTPVDPMLLFAPPDLTKMVRLIPTEDAIPEVAPYEAERAAAEEWFLPQGPPEWLTFGQPDSGGLGLGAVLAPLRDGVAVLLAVGTTPSLVLIREGGRLVVAAGQGVNDWWKLRGRCSGDAPPAEGYGGTGRHLFAVSGLNSFTHADGSTNALRPAELGYAAEDVSWFSYAEDGGRFRPADTQDGPEVAAGRLADQLREFAAAHPGRAVDLIGHSQGGVVVEAFLKLHYTGHEDEYPPLGEVVTLAAPHRGAPLAALALDLAAVPGIDEFSDAIDQPPPSSGSVRQLAEGSGFIHDLASTPVPDGVDFTTIGAVGDVLVPADQTQVDGAANLVVDPDGWWEHGAIVTDEEALGAVRLVLADAPPPCLSLPEAVRYRVEPELIHAAYRLVG